MLDELKSCHSADVIAEYSAGRVWLLVRNSDTDASVQRCALRDLPAAMLAGACELLQFWRDVGTGGDATGRSGVSSRKPSVSVASRDTVQSGARS